MARPVHFEIQADDLDTEGNTFGIHQPDPEAA